MKLRIPAKSIHVPPLVLDVPKRTHVNWILAWAIAVVAALWGLGVYLIVLAFD